MPTNTDAEVPRAKIDQGQNHTINEPKRIDIVNLSAPCSISDTK